MIYGGSHWFREVRGGVYAILAIREKSPMDNDMTDEVLSIIRRLAEKDKIALKKHSAFRMHQRGISIDEVKEALTNGEIIEEYPEDYPFQASCSWDIPRQKGQFMQLLS